MVQAGAQAAPGRAEWLVLGLLVIIWGSAFAGIRIAVETLSPIWVAAMRLWVATGFLGVWIAVEALAGRMRRSGIMGADVSAAAATPPDRGRLTIRAVLAFVVVGTVFTGAPFFAFGEAGLTESSAVLAICNGGTPMFTALLAWMFVPGEGMTWRRAFGVAFGFAGLLILVAPELTGGIGAVSGLAFAIGGAALYAGGNIVTRLAPKVGAALSGFIIAGSGAVFTTLVALAMGEPLVGGSTASWIATVLLGLAPTGLAMILYVWLIQKAGPMFLAQVTYLNPLWAAALGVVLLGEAFTLTMAGALMLILTGVAIANMRPRALVRLRP